MRIRVLCAIVVFLSSLTMAPMHAAPSGTHTVRILAEFVDDVIWYAIVDATLEVDSSGAPVNGSGCAELGHPEYPQGAYRACGPLAVAVDPSLTVALVRGTVGNINVDLRATGHDAWSIDRSRIGAEALDVHMQREAFGTGSVTSNRQGVMSAEAFVTYFEDIHVSR